MKTIVIIFVILTISCCLWRSIHFKTKQELKEEKLAFQLDSTTKVNSALIKNIEAIIDSNNIDQKKVDDIIARRFYIIEQQSKGNFKHRKEFKLLEDSVKIIIQRIDTRIKTYSKL